MEHHNYQHDSGMGSKGSKSGITGNEDLPMIGHVIRLLSALVSIIGIISDNLGKQK